MLFFGIVEIGKRGRGYQVLKKIHGFELFLAVSNHLQSFDCCVRPKTGANERFHEVGTNPTAEGAPSCLEDGETSDPFVDSPPFANGMRYRWFHCTAID